MKKNICALLLILTIPGCSWFTDNKKVVGSGNPARQERDVVSFNEIEVYGQGVLIVTQGDHHSLAIEADDNLLQYINTAVHGNELRITIEDGMHIEPRTLVKYYVMVKDIKEIELHGAAQLRTDGITSDKLELELSGSAHVDASLNVGSLKVEATGATKCNLDGAAKKQDLQLTGSSEYNAGSLVSESVKVEASGAARVTVHAEKELKAAVSGAVFIGYKGEPMLSIKQSGAASISKVG